MGFLIELLRPYNNTNNKQLPDQSDKTKDSSFDDEETKTARKSKDFSSS